MNAQINDNQKMCQDIMLHRILITVCIVNICVRLWSRKLFRLGDKCDSYNCWSRRQKGCTQQLFLSEVIKPLESGVFNSFFWQIETFNTHMENGTA